MSLIRRIKVLWYLSGLDYTKDSVKLPTLVETKAKKYREALKRKRPATVVPDEPQDFFPAAEEEYDSTSERPSTD